MSEQTSMTVELPLAIDHPVFAGHFPTRPMLPGALLIDMAIAAIEAHCQRRVVSVARAKFLRPVTPGEALELSFTLNGDRLNVRLHSGSYHFADAQFILAGPAAS